MVLAAAERDAGRAALPARRRVHEWTYRRARPARARTRRRARRRWASRRATGSRSSADAAGVDARRLRRLCAGRGRRADLPHELAGGVPVRARPLRRARGDRARTPRRSRRSQAVRASCPALEHVVVDRRRGARAPCARRAARARRGDGRRVARRARSQARRARRRGDDRLHVGHDRPAEGLRAHARATCSRRSTMYERQLELAGERRRSSCSCRSRTCSRASTQLVALDVGGTLAFWSGDPARLLEDLAASRPTHFPSVPRVFEKVHTGALAAWRTRRRAQRALFDWALATGRRARGRRARAARVGPLAARAPRARRPARARPRCAALFGDRLELALTGAAPIAPRGPRVLRRLRRARRSRATG